MTRRDYKFADLDFRHPEKGVVMRADAGAMRIVFHISADTDHRLNISNDNLRLLAFVLER